MRARVARNVVAGAACAGVIGALVMATSSHTVSVVPLALYAVVGGIVSLAYMRGEPR